MILVTANIGDFDHPVSHKAGIRSFYYTEKNLPHPLTNLNNRLKGKYIKILTHRIHPLEKTYLWVDGSVEVLSDAYALFMADKLNGYDVAVPLHPERSNVYEEFLYIQKNIVAGKQYLVARYAKQPLKEEEEFLVENKLPPNYPLFACRTFARVNNDLVNNAFNEWWMGCLEYSNFDQSMFSYIVWKYKLKINTFPYAELDKFLKVYKHKKIS